MYTRVSAMVILVVVSILHSNHLSMVFTPKKYFFLVLKATDAQYAEHSLKFFYFLFREKRKMLIQTIIFLNDLMNLFRKTEKDVGRSF